MTTEVEICSWRTSLTIWHAQVIHKHRESIKWAVTRGERWTGECPSHEGWRGMRKEAEFGTLSSCFPRSLGLLHSSLCQSQGRGGKAEGEEGVVDRSQRLLTLNVCVFHPEDTSSYLWGGDMQHNNVLKQEFRAVSMMHLLKLRNWVMGENKLHKFLQKHEWITVHSSAATGQNAFPLKRWALREMDSLASAVSASCVISGRRVQTKTHISG